MRMSMIRNQAMIKRVVEQYQSGISTNEIGRSEGHSHTYICSILKEQGIERRSHKEAAKSQQKWVNCIICNKLFHPGKNPNRKTCSDACFIIRMRQIQEGSQNSNWNGGFSQKHYQRIAKANKEWKCRICKTEENLQVHHIDKDQSNNNISNLEILCVSCHAKVHYDKGDGFAANEWNAVGSKRQPLSPEHKEKISKALKGRKGKPMTSEHKAKLMVCRLGNIASPETRAKMSAAQKGRIFTPEWKAKISAAKKGKKLGKRKVEV